MSIESYWKKVYRVPALYRPKLPGTRVINYAKIIGEANDGTCKVIATVCLLRNGETVVNYFHPVAKNDQLAFNVVEDCTYELERMWRRKRLLSGWKSEEAASIADANGFILTDEEVAY